MLVWGANVNFQDPHSMGAVANRNQTDEEEY